MDNPINTPVILSICPGIGGLERGLERAIGKLTIAAFVEIEAFIVANLVAQMECGLLDPAPIWSDVKTLSPDLFRGKINGVLAGYSCQPFSHAGERRGKEDPRHIFPYILEIVKRTRPLFCFFENVSGHLSLGYDEVYRSLSDLGYSVEAGIYSAEEVGAPHRRERLFILAILEDSGFFGWGGGNNGDKGGSERSHKATGSSPSLGNTENSYKRNDWSKGQVQNFQNRRSDPELANPSEQGLEKSRLRGTRQFGKEEGEGLHNRPELRGDTVDHSSSIGLQPEYAIQAGRDGVEPTGQTRVALGDSKHAGLQRHAGDDCREEGWAREERSVASSSVFPAGQGDFQYDWEESRAIEFPLVNYANGNKDRIDLSFVNYTYEIYTTKKTRAIEVLHSLWRTISSEGLQWSPRRLYSFLEKEVLFTDLYGVLQNKRLSFCINSFKTIQTFQERDMRKNMWINKPIGNTPQGQDQIEQLRREFADAMCILSYQLTLGRRKDTESGNYDQTMQYLRHDYKNAWWDVPETLSEIQKIWRLVSDKDAWERQLVDAYKSYRLELFGTVFGYNPTEDLHRAIGNSVVEQTAEIAFIDLLRKHGLTVETWRQFLHI